MRLSDVQSKTTAYKGHEPDASSDNEAASTEDHQNAGPPLTQYEIDRDGDFSHLQHEDEDDARATQKLLRRTERIGNNQPADNGIIISVNMINFMCHEKLHVTLGPLINFIIGVNGSGKSAALSAIAICLGGKASTTNRGGSLKSFIKSGQDKALITIKIKNEGDDAYRPEMFGHAIIVERHFSRNGSGGFALKSSKGNVVSRLKADVDDMIEYFQMQIDNPMNILTQDSARNFLTRSTAAQKFKFFVKGVQLEQLDNDYRLLCETTEAMQSKMNGMKAEVKVKEDLMKAARRKAQAAENSSGMRDEVSKLRYQMAWAQVIEEEVVLANREESVSATGALIDERKRMVDAKSAAFDEADLKYETSQASLQQMSDGAAPLQEEEAQAKLEMDSATEELAKCHQEQRTNRDLLVTAKKKAAGFEEDVRKEEWRIEDVNGGGHTRKLEDLAKAESKVQDIRAQIEASSEAAGPLQDDLHKARQELDKVVTPLEVKRSELRACEDTIRSLTKDANQALSGYDPKVIRLMTMIKDDKQFRERPVGPVGLHIRLRNPIWSNILERSIGNILGGFIVTSKADQQRLSELMRRFGIENSPVVIGNNHPIDLRGHEPDESLETVLRVLDIDNELVRRQLIINQAIEQTVLIEDRREGEQLMYAGARPKNVKQCFTLHSGSGRRGWGIRLGFMQGNGNNATSSPIKPPHGKPRMKTDVDSQIRYQKETLESLRNEEHALQDSKRELEQSLQRCHHAIKQHSQRHKSIEIALQRADDVVDRLRTELDQSNVVDGRLHMLNSLLLDEQKAVKMHEGSYIDIGARKVALNEASLLAKTKLDQAKLHLQDYEMQVKKAKDKALRLGQARSLTLSEKNAALELVEEARAEHAKALGRCKKQRERVEAFAKEASEIHPRVELPPGATPMKLDAKLNKMIEQLKLHNARLGGTEDQLKEAYVKAQLAYAIAEKQYATLDQTLQLLKTSYHDRVERWRKFQRHISSRARMNFTYLLSERGFRGRLRIDHQRKLLDLHIEPDETVKSQKGRQTKTLSGGEKSFSNTCLLLSLWEAMGAPLRCLDEFDVFMDSVNRDISTKLIVRMPSV